MRRRNAEFGFLSLVEPCGKGQATAWKPLLNEERWTKLGGSMVPANPLVVGGKVRVTKRSI